MLINEVEEKLQMSSHTLRYYEKMGLIKPTRNENGYRNYSNEDIQILKKIRFLRELDIPIESIIEMNDQTLDFQNILDQHLKTIDLKIKSLEYVQQLCQSLKEKDIPLLEAMTNDKIIKEEEINKTEVKKGLKKIVSYLKPSKTVVLGARCDFRNYIKGLLVAIPFSILGGIIFGFGLFNMLQRFSNYDASGLTFLIATLISYIVIAILISCNSGNQNYIELRDRYIYICHPDLQTRTSVLLGMILKQTDQRNRQYTWQQLLRVEVKLEFSSMSGGHSGLYRTYVPTFIFYFADGYKYTISAGTYFGEDIKTAYMIIQSKNIQLIANDEMKGYLNQTQKTVYEYFEEIYHLNSKKNDITNK